MIVTAPVSVAVANIHGSKAERRIPLSLRDAWPKLFPNFQPMLCGVRHKHRNFLGEDR